MFVELIHWYHGIFSEKDNQWQDLLLPGLQLPGERKGEEKCEISRGQNTFQHREAKGGIFH